MIPSRRRWLGAIGRLSLLKLGAMLPVFAPVREAAAASSAPDPAPDRFREAMSVELRGADAAESPDIMLDVPVVAEDGAVVPIEIESRIPETERLALFVEKNPYPLIAAFQFSPGAAPYVSVRIKMNESSAVVVVARSRGKYYRTTQRVRVVRGGCG